MDPLLSIQLCQRPPCYQSGGTMHCDYQIDAVAAEEISAVEASVLWFTEGKGDEDMSVHYFERRIPADAEGGDLRPLRRFQTQLPNTPLSYSGQILSIRWCVRLRVFFKNGRQACDEQPFTLAAASNGWH
jgi:hypothetical protein